MASRKRKFTPAQRRKQKDIAEAVKREHPGMSKSRSFAIAGGAVKKQKRRKK